MFLAILALAAAAHASSAAQDKPAPASAPAVQPAPVLKDVDGKDVVPGAIPASTTPAARERWQKVLKAGLPSGAESAPITAFDLAIDVRRSDSNGQTNDMPSFRCQWLAPRYVRADTGRASVRLRGPKGSYLIDSSNSDHVEVIKLDVSKESALDRRELDEQAGIAANFARLSDPNSIRIRKLTELAGAPAWLPESLRKDAQSLAWLELESPDFFVMRPETSKPAPLARVAMGVNVVDNRVQQVVVDDAAAPASIGASTAVLKLGNYKPTDGFQVPFVIFVWLPVVPDPKGAPGPARWTAKETMSMYLKSAALRAPLKPDDFLPPK